MVRLRTHPGEPRPRNCKVIRRQENFRPATCRFMCRRLRLFSLFPPSMVVKFSDSKLKREAVSYLSRPAIHHCWASAKTFREKKLPCDALIYLGTGFCPSGWNTENGSFSWNSRVFPEPKEIIEKLHKDSFRVVLHDVILTDKLHGTAHDQCELALFDAQNASCYWDAHRKDFAMGA